MNKSTESTQGTTLDLLAQDADAQVQKRYAEQKAQGIVNPIVLAALIKVRPQMIYNYLNKGKLTEVEDAVGTNSTQKKVIDITEANTFAKKYRDDKVARAEKAKAKLEAELAGETVDA